MTQNHKKILAKIEELQREILCSLEDFRSIKELPTGRRGLYWIWSNLSLDELQGIPHSKGGKGGIMEVPIEELVSQRRGLANICKVSKILKRNKFTIVYNGIGGYETNPKSSGLRGRINQEFRCGTGDQTGTLNMENRHRPGSFNEANWAVSYFDFDANKKLLDEYRLSYEDAEALERNWRIEYGTPILTRH